MVRECIPEAGAVEQKADFYFFDIFFIFIFVFYFYFFIIIIINKKKSPMEQSLNIEEQAIALRLQVGLWDTSNSLSYGGALPWIGRHCK